MTVKAKNVTSTEREQEYMEYVEGFGLTHFEAEVLTMSAMWVPELKLLENPTKPPETRSDGSIKYKKDSPIPSRVAAILRKGGVILKEREVDWGLVEAALCHPFVKAGITLDGGLLTDRERDDSEP